MIYRYVHGKLGNVQEREREREREREIWLTSWLNFNMKSLQKLTDILVIVAMFGNKTFYDFRKFHSCQIV